MDAKKKKGGVGRVKRSLKKKKPIKKADGPLFQADPNPNIPPASLQHIYSCRALMVLEYATNPAMYNKKAHDKETSIKSNKITKEKNA